MRVHLDADKCCGAGQCVLTAPEVFDQRDSDGLGYVLDPSPPEELWAKVRDAEHRCPARSISVHDPG